MNHMIISGYIIIHIIYDVDLEIMLMVDYEKTQKLFKFLFFKLFFIERNKLNLPILTYQN